MNKRLLRFLTVLLILTLCLAIFAACETNTEEPDPDDPGTDPTVDPDTPTDDHTHSYGSWTQTKAPTCTDSGTETRTCSCGDVQTRSVAALGHDWQDLKAVAAGCVTTGLTDGRVCARCGAQDPAQDVVPSLGGHIYDGSNTCTRCHETVPVPDGAVFTPRADGTYELTKYTGSATTLVLNDIFNGVPVTSIKERVFANKTTLTNVTLPAGLVEIKASAFEGCVALKNVALPETLTKLGQNAFKGCEAMTACTVPASVEAVEDYAYAGCSALKNVTIKNGVKTIGVGAFMGTAVAQVALPASVETVGNYAYKDCANLSNISVAATVKAMGGMAFDGCAITRASVPVAACAAVSNAALQTVEIVGTGEIPYGVFRTSENLTSVTVANTVTGIREGAFEGCSALTQITLPFVGGRAAVAEEAWQHPFGYVFGRNRYEGSYAVTQEFYGSSPSSLTTEVYYLPTTLVNVKLVGGAILYGAFSGCKKITQITISNTTTKIGEHAFYYCESLRSVNFPSLLTSIGAEAFRGCSLESVSLSANMSTLGNGVFRDCPVRSATSPAGFLQYIPKTALTSVVVNGGTEIEANTFYECTTLESVTVASSVNKIGSNAFYGCTNLANVNVSDIRNWYATKWDNEYSNPMMYATTLNVGSSPLTEYEVPEGTTEIKANAFYNVTSLERLTLTGSLTTIGANAFYNCTALRDVNFEESRVRSIGEYAFAYCTSLTAVTLPPTLRTLSGYAFASCYGLMEVTIDEGVTVGGEGIFSDCHKLVHIVNASSEEGSVGVRIVTSPAAVGGEILKEKNAAFKNEIARDDDGVITFTVSANKKVYFLGYAGESETVDLSKSNVTDVYAYALYGNDTVREVVLHNGVSTLGERAFSECSALYSISVVKDTSVSDQTITVGLDAFTGTAITDATLPISAFGYLDVTKLENLTVISGRLESAMAMDLGNIRHLYIGEDVSVIYEGAFAGAPNLESITVADKNHTYVSVNNCLIWSNSKTLLLGTKNSTIPNDGTVATIGSYAFAGSQIGSVTIPDSVTTIGDRAFRNCAALANVTFGSRISTIGDEAFYGCSALTTLSIPSSVTSVGKGLLVGCGALRDLTIGRGITSVEAGILYGCGSLETLSLPFVGKTGIAADMAQERYPFGYIFGIVENGEPFEGAKSVTQTVYRATLSSLAVAYNIPTGLTGVSIEGGRVEQNMFDGCDTIRSIYVGEVLYVAEEAFVGCTELESLTVEQGLTSIPSGAFASLKKLRRVVLPDGLTTIGSGAFWNCSMLSQINFPTTLRVIGSEAFRGCSSLSTVRFLEADGKPAIETIGENAFAESGLNYIVYEGKKAEWLAVDKIARWDGGKTSYTVNCTDANL